jgi:hypothetical protein
LGPGKSSGPNETSPVTFTDIPGAFTLTILSLSTDLDLIFKLPVTFNVPVPVISSSLTFGAVIVTVPVNVTA